MRQKLLRAPRPMAPSFGNSASALVLLVLPAILIQIAIQRVAVSQDNPRLPQNSLRLIPLLKTLPPTTSSISARVRRLRTSFCSPFVLSSSPQMALPEQVICFDVYTKHAAQ